MLTVASTTRSDAIEPSGTTVAVIQSAAVAGVTGSRMLQTEAPVFMGDRINTGSIGEAQLRFRDDTRLVVGPNSSMVIDSFVFNSDNTASKVVVQAVRGAFRFISGKSGKQAYAIATPSLTIGIRGTRFDFSVLANGETNFALYEGQARLCDRTQHCVELSGRCEVAVTPLAGGIRELEPGQERASRIQNLFPYANAQSRLQPDFRVDTSSCGVQRASLPPATDHFIGRAPAATPGPDPDPDPKPEPANRGNPGNNLAVGNAGDKFGSDPGERGRSSAARGRR